MPDTEDLNLDDVFASDRAERGNPEASAEVTPSQPRDEAGRFAPKTQDEPAAEAKPDPAPQPDAQPDPEPEVQIRHVPLKELQTERQKRQEEARLRLEAEARARVLEEQFARLQTQRVAPQPPAQPVQPPDPYTDPEGYTQFQVSRVKAEMENRLLFMSEAQTRAKHGDEVVNEALTLARQHGDPSHFSRYPDPWGAMVQWAQRQKALSRIGPDPDAYEKTVEERVKAQILADLKAGKLQANGQAPQPRPKFPGTLADGTASGNQAAHYSDEAMMDEVFGSQRRRA